MIFLDESYLYDDQFAKKRIQEFFEDYKTLVEETEQFPSAVNSMTIGQENRVLPQIMNSSTKLINTIS